MKPCTIPQNKTTRAIFKKGGLFDDCKKGGPRRSPHSPRPISTTADAIVIHDLLQIMNHNLKDLVVLKHRPKLKDLVVLKHRPKPHKVNN